MSPERGLYRRLSGVSIGGQPLKVGGPAGTFIVLLSTAAAKYGLDILLLAVMMSGFLLTVIGAFGLGGIVRYIPQAVTVDFTCGIAVIIAASQLRDLGGLAIAGEEPGQLLFKLVALVQALPTLNPAALSVGLGSAALIFTLQRGVLRGPPC